MAHSLAILLHRLARTTHYGRGVRDKTNQSSRDQKAKRGGRAGEHPW